MTGLLLKALAIAATIAGLIGGGYIAGRSTAKAEAQTQIIQAEREARASFDAEVKRGDRAVAALAAEQLQQAADYAQLQGAFNDLRRRAPLVRPAPERCPSAGAGPLDGVAPPDAPDLDAAGAEPVALLTHAAVWMWNSALTGRDTPSGACSLADPATGACAAAAPVTLDDAWANHATNARLCAEDRLSHQRLIDFLKERQP